MLWHLPLSGLLAIRCVDSAISENRGTFVSFNDLVPNDEGPLGRQAGCFWNRFTHGRHWERGGGVLAADSQVLIDSDGLNSPATVRFEEVVTHENTINNHVVPIVLKRGSPAWTEFADCFCPEAVCDESSGECECAALDGSLSYNDAPGWEFKYVFEGLDPHCEAEVTFFADRGGAHHDPDTDYNERYSIFTLSAVSGFTPDTGSALRALQGGASLAIRSGNNSAGHVAKWSNIRHAGSFVVSVSHGRTRTLCGVGVFCLSDLSPLPHAYKAYAGGVFRLSQVCEQASVTSEGPATVAEEPLEASGGLVVSVALSLEVEDPVAFVSDESSPALVAHGIAAVAGIDVSDVAVVLSVMSRRLLGARRLTGFVTADTAIVVADATAAEALRTLVAQIEPAALASSVNDALMAAGKAAAVIRVEIGTPVIESLAPPTDAQADVADRVNRLERESDTGRRPKSHWWKVVAAMVILAVAAYRLVSRSRRWRRVWPSPSVQSDSTSDDAAAASDASGDHEANTDVHAINKIISEKDDDLNSQCSTITPSSNASNVSLPVAV